MLSTPGTIFDPATVTTRPELYSPELFGVSVEYNGATSSHYQFTLLTKSLTSVPVTVSTLGAVLKLAVTAPLKPMYGSAIAYPPMASDAGGAAHRISVALMYVPAPDAAGAVPYVHVSGVVSYSSVPRTVMVEGGPK